jgi:uncharacterized protein (TIGR02145 family)
VPDAPNSAFYTVSAHFADTYFTGGDIHSKNILFRCSLSNPANLPAISPAKVTSNLDILFINTSTAGYGTDANGIKYLLLGKGSTTPAFKVALLNLGQSDNNDAGDLGDFYQWGRVADGHQKTAWSKNASRVNQILPMSGGANNTSAVIAYSSINASAATYTDGKNGNDNVTPFHQVKTTLSSHDKFISTGESGTNGYNQWYNITHTTAVQDNYLWGQNGQSATNRTPAKNGNDPCPSGWQVPSRWQFIDIYDGNALSDGPAHINWGNYNNNWAWRDGVNNAVGGVLITNANGEVLFVPAVGYRESDNGVLVGSIGSYGGCWSSTYFDTDDSYLLIYSNDGVSINGQGDKADGFPVRCVSE